MRGTGEIIKKHLLPLTYNKLFLHISTKNTDIKEIGGL